MVGSRYGEFKGVMVKWVGLKGDGVKGVGGYWVAGKRG